MLVNSIRIQILNRANNLGRTLFKTLLLLPYFEISHWSFSETEVFPVCEEPELEEDNVEQVSAAPNLSSYNLARLVRAPQAPPFHSQSVFTRFNTLLNSPCKMASTKALKHTCFNFLFKFWLLQEVPRRQLRAQDSGGEKSYQLLMSCLWSTSLVITNTFAKC